MKKRQDRFLSGSLGGLVILDLAQLITGPWCASMLGDLGAEVIKVEAPLTGEALRQIGPFVENESVLFLSVNRNKRSLTVDLSREEGRAILDRLITRADVFIQNFRPDIRQAYGVEYDRVRSVKPDIVYLSVSAFGENGPYRLKPGTDHVFQGLSGLMSVSGHPSQGPLRVGVPAADMTAALYSCLGVLSALFHRQATGEGQEIRINLLDAAMCLQQTTITDYLLTGREPEPTGNSSPFACPVGMFPTKDGYINVAAFNNKFWRALCRALESEDLSEEPHFKTPEQRLARRDELEEILYERFALGTTSQWLERLETADVPCGPVHTYSSLMTDPQVRANKLIRDLPHAGLGSIRTLGQPLAFSVSPVQEKTGAPQLGQHSDEILNELGYSAGDIVNLHEQGII